MYGRRRTETRRCWRRVLPVSFSVAVVLSGTWVVEAQAQTEPCPPGQPPDGCCTPAPSANEADEEEGLDQDCPGGDHESDGGRSHRRGDDAVGADNDTGSADGSFRSGRRFRRGSGGGGEEPDGTAPVEGIGGGPEGAAPGGGPAGAAPGGGTTGGAPPTPGPVARSSPAVRAPSAPPRISAPAGSASTSGARAGAGAGQVAGSMARTGPDIATRLGLALTLLLAGTSLRRANRPLPRTPRRARPAPRPEPAPPNWSYVDHSSSARAFEKF